MIINLSKRKAAIFSLLIIIVLIFVLLPDASKIRERSYSKVICDKEGEILRVFLNENQQWFFPPDENLIIPDKLYKAVTLFEDRYFKYHPGVNPVAIVKALSDNLSNKRIIRGGSTLTMQLVSLSNPKPRSYWNKFCEMLLAIKLEILYSKQEIIRMYLERAPYGGNVIGYKAASMRYFRKLPNELSWGESAALAVLPNAPGLISPGMNRDQLIKKRNKLLKQLNKAGLIDENELGISCKEPLPVEANVFPIHAPHFTRYIKNNTPGEDIVKTSLNSMLQSNAENILKEYSYELNNLGIQNCAAIITETKTGKIRSWVGSQDFWDNKHSGQVDGVIAKRSTGSVLKPFLYAASMDQGLILPETLMNDVPSYYGTFSPENASHTYSGLVTAAEALTRSLNVPAVRLLKKYGLYSFYSLLKRAGVNSLFRSADEYGLTLIIGGSEISLLELSTLYNGLGNSGLFKDVSFREDTSADKGKRLLSEGACYLTLEILNDLKRSGADKYWDVFDGKRKIAWKTGTSYGHRDAWAAGVTPEWTVCVWAGNFTGEMNPQIVGVSAAGPLMFRLFELLEEKEGDWFSMPLQELEPVTLCAETGFTAGDNCDNTIESWKPLNAPLVKVCPYHKKVFISKTKHYQVCSLCWEREDVKDTVLLVYPPHAVEYLASSGKSIPIIPEHNPECETKIVTPNLEIVYPIDGFELFIPRDATGKHQKIVLKAAHSKPETIIYWYLNDKYLTSTSTEHNVVTDVDKGDYKLSLIDESGNETSIKFSVSQH